METDSPQLFFVRRESGFQCKGKRLGAPCHLALLLFAPDRLLIGVGRIFGRVLGHMHDCLIFPNTLRNM